MSSQKQLFSPEERRRRARRIKTEIVLAARLPPTLKAVISVLWEFYGDNRFCWPSLKKLAMRLGHSWPGSRRAVQTKLKELATLRLIVIEPAERSDGSTTSNKYRILWGNLQRTSGEVKKVARVLQGASQQAPPRVSASAPPRLSKRPPASQQAPLEPVLNPQRTPTDSVAGPDEKTDGDGGDFGKKNKPESESHSNKPPGWWAGKFTASDLRDKSFVVWLYGMAVKFQIIRPCPENQVRIVGLCLQATDDPSLKSVTGWVIDTIEGGWWNRVSKESMRLAIEKSKVSLTDDQRRTLRDIEPFNGE